MDSEAKFWIAITASIVVGFCAFIAGVSFWIANSNSHYYETAQKCIASNGEWFMGKSCERQTDSKDIRRGIGSVSRATEGALK